MLLMIKSSSQFFMDRQLIFSRNNDQWILGGTLLFILSFSFFSMAALKIVNISQLVWATLCISNVMLFGIVLWVLRARMIDQKQEILKLRRAQENLQFDSERTQWLTQSTGIGVWEYDLQNGCIHWDQAMFTIYGVQPRETLMTLQDWMHHVAPEDVGKLRNLMLETSYDNQDTAELIFNIDRANDGAIRHIQTKTKRLKNTKNTSFKIIGTHVDITLQQQLKNALREAQERFHASFEWAATGMAMLDLKGNFLQINQALSDTLGYEKQELLGRHFDSITHPNDTTQHTHLIREVLKGDRHNYQIEKRYIHKSGHVVWALVSVSAVRNDQGRVIYFISQIQNITTWRRNEAALIEREHFLRTLSECLPGLVSYWSTDLRCHFANKNHEKWSNLPADKMRGQHMQKVLGEELFTHDYQYILGVLKGEKQRFERRRSLPFGGYADLLIHLVPDVLYGQVEGFFSISTNVTDFKAQQRELERINCILTERTEQAEAANKAKGAFLANMSHEIRTPMNAIMGILQLLEETELQAKQVDYLNKISSAADVLLNVLNDILDVSRIEANKLELSNRRFLLDQLLDQCTDLFTYHAKEKAIQLHCIKENHCPVSLKGDRLRLAQILNNLLSNAFKFTESGHIHLQVKWIEHENQIQFCVKDTGIGMNAQQCTNIFKPFSQADDSISRRYGGAGLGLSICKSLVELMDGHIWVESQLGKGASFYFKIRCVEPEFEMPPQDKQKLKKEPALSELKNNELDSYPMLNKHVLVVDDHKLNRVVASEMLKKWGAKVSLAENGQQAVQACLTEKFDIVLMDLQMPEMDGYEATTTILGNLGLNAPPIIAITASASLQDRLEILNAGMCEHIIKPFKKETLMQTILKIQKQ